MANTELTHPRDETTRQKSNPRAALLATLPMTERRLDLAGISTAILEGGDGPPVVLLHGPGEYAGKWLRIIPELVQTHRVIAPDLPGHGTTSTGTAPDAAQVLTWLDALIESTCDTPPVLVGQILGGAIAARYAATAGSRLCALVLSDALGISGFEPAPEFGAALMAFVTEPSAAAHDRLWQHCAYDLPRMQARMGSAWDRVRAYNLDRAQVPELKPMQHGLMEQFGFPPIDPADLQRITVPTWLIWGRHDLATPLAVAEVASARYGWPLTVIEAAGDDPPMEQPEAFLAALAPALEIGAVPADTRGAWDAIAPGYDRTNTPTQMWLGNEALRRAGLQPGMTFLDVAAGSGALSIPAARIGAEVTAVDQSPAMLDLLEIRAGAEGVQVETRVMDGQVLALGDGRFDLAGSQFGVMLFPDMPRGIREMARVVRPGGKVLIIAYGDPHQIDFLWFLVRAIQAVRPAFDGPPSDPPPLPFQLSDPARLERELVAAGLRDVQVETITERTSFASGDTLWDWILSSNPIVEEVLGSLALSDAERDSIRDRLAELVRERAGGEGPAVLTNPVHIGIGAK